MGGEEKEKEEEEEEEEEEEVQIESERKGRERRGEEGDGQLQAVLSRRAKPSFLPKSAISALLEGQKEKHLHTAAAAAAE